MTDRHDGDFRVDGEPDELDERRRSVFAGEWSWLRQVHGAQVVAVNHIGEGAGSEADAAVTEQVDAVLCVQTADCVPVVLVGDGVLGVAHAGWRGLVAGVIQETVDAMQQRRPGAVAAIIGPCIRPASYEFGEAELAQVEVAVGGSARATTSAGRPALDMATATAHALRAAGVTSIDDLGFDTADPRWFSHRVRRDGGRQVTAARLVAS
ncbi:MAG: polyphenol oxidase family protein [Actinomycetota bacterium]